MIDNIMNSLRRGMGRARTRGEELAQTTRLRYEIYQLNRELDSLYGRLGRSYHSNADVEVLQPIRDDIARVDAEILARERLLEEVTATQGTGAPVVRGEGVTTERTVITPGSTHTEPVTARTASNATAQAAPRDVPPATPVNVRPAVGTHADRPDRDDPLYNPPGPDELAGPTEPESRRGRDNRADEPNEDYQKRVDEGQTVSLGNKTDASLHGSDAPIPPMGTLAGNEDAVRRAPVTPNISPEEVHQDNLGKQEDIEARRASRDPDPLD